jgi:hypothetical protein
MVNFGSISKHVIFRIGAGCHPKDPVAEGEPTGLVPRGAGAEGGMLRLSESPE